MLEGKRGKDEIGRSTQDEYWERRNRREHEVRRKEKGERTKVGKK